MGRISHSEQSVHCTPNRVYTALRTECTPHSEQSVHRTPLGGYIALRARYICPLARVVPAHSLGWYLPTRSGGTCPLARVVPTHSLWWYLRTRPSGTCTPKLYKLLRGNVEFSIQIDIRPVTFFKVLHGLCRFIKLLAFQLILQNISICSFLRILSHNFGLSA